MNSLFFQNSLIPILKELGFSITEILPKNMISGYFWVGSIEIPFLIKFSENTNGDITEDDIKLFYADLNIAGLKNKGLKGLFIVLQNFTETAMKTAKELGIALTTYEDILSSTVDFSAYLLGIIADYETSDLNKSYISPNVRTLNGDYVPLQTELEQWMDDPQKNILFLLGDSGMGKTSFAKNFSYTLSGDFIKDRSGIPIPVFIELKDYKNTLNLSNLIIYHLFNVHNLSLRSFNAFVHLLKEGRLLLILDGFDELVGDYESFEAKHFIQELFLLATGKAKIVLTSHSEYFLFNPDEATKPNFNATLAFEKFQNKDNYTLLTLRTFKYDQIAMFIKEKTGLENKTFLKNVQTDKKLREIVKYPVMLNLLLEMGLKPVKTKKELFDEYVEKWLKDDNWMVHLTRDGKSLLAQELAWLLWSQNRKSIHYTELPEILSHYIRKEFKQKRDNDYLLTDIQATPFMLNDNGMCSFVHDIFVDYFASAYISKMINEDDKTFTLGRYVTKSLAEFLCERLSPVIVFNYFSNLIKTSNNRKTKAYAVVALYNLNEYIEENKSDISKSDYTTISESSSFRYFDLSGVDLKGAKLSNASFMGANLAYSNLQSASLFSANFENADLTKSLLEKADFRYAKLRHANMINTDGSFTLFINADLTGIICVDAKLIEVNMMNCDCSDAKFNQSNLHAALGINSIMKNVNLNKADLQNADFTKANFDGAVFNETNLNHTLLESSSLKNITMNNCYTWGAEMMNCTFDSSVFSNLDMKNVKLAFSSIKKSTLNKIDFEFSDLRDVNFSGSNFIQVNFENADVRGAVFNDCKFDKITEDSLKSAYGYITPANEKPKQKKDIKADENIKPKLVNDIKQKTTENNKPKPVKKPVTKTVTKVKPDETVKPEESENEDGIY